MEQALTDAAIKRVKATDLEEREINASLKYEIKDKYIGNSEEQIGITDTPEAQANALRVLPSTTDLSVLTSVFDH